MDQGYGVFLRKLLQESHKRICVKLWVEHLRNHSARCTEDSNDGVRGCGAGDHRVSTNQGQKHSHWRMGDVYVDEVGWGQNQWQSCNQI